MTKSITDRIEELGHQARDAHQDGFSCFGSKKELYKIKWAVEKELSKTNSFFGEEDWVKENEPK